MKELKDLIRDLERFINEPTENNLEQLKDCFYATNDDYIVSRSHISEMDDLEIILVTEDIDFEELIDILSGLKEVI